MQLPPILKRVLPEPLIAIGRLWWGFWVVRSTRSSDQRQLSPDLIISGSPAAILTGDGGYAPHYNFVLPHQTLKVSPAIAADVTDPLWEMLDVVDLLDAVEAKRKREQPNAVFDVEGRRIGEGYYVSVTMPDGEPRCVTETFKTEGEARHWIRNESVAWLNTQSLRNGAGPAS
jgi:hypothetical protein